MAVFFPPNRAPMRVSFAVCRAPNRAPMRVFFFFGSLSCTKSCSNACFFFAVCHAPNRAPMRVFFCGFSCVKSCSNSCFFLGLSCTKSCCMVSIMLKSVLLFFFWAVL